MNNGRYTTQVQNILKNVKFFIENMLQREAAKSNSPLSLQSGEFQTQIEKQFPQQGHNVVDCGVFMLKGVDCLSRNVTPKFSLKEIPYFRTLITLELLLGKLLIPPSK